MVMGAQQIKANVEESNIESTTSYFTVHALLRKCAVLVFLVESEDTFVGRNKSTQSFPFFLPHAHTLGFKRSDAFGIR